VLNDPVNFIDPNGEFWLPVAGWLFKKVAKLFHQDEISGIAREAIRRKIYEDYFHDLDIGMCPLDPDDAAVDRKNRRLYELAIDPLAPSLQPGLDQIITDQIGSWTTPPLGVP
jgi:hypothetical protein